MRRKVVTVTDCTDVAYLEIRGAIYASASSEDYELEPVVRVPAYNIVNTAFLIRLLAEIYPEGTIIHAVVHPTQIRCERIIGRTEKRDIIFEGTNTGAFGWLLQELGCRELYELEDPGFLPFGGKQVHAPAIGRLLSGEPLGSMGRPFSPERIRTVEVAKGAILHIDNFGNIKFKGTLHGKNGDRYMVRAGEKEFKAIYWERMMDRPDGETVLYRGSSFGLPELAVVRGNAAEMYGIGYSDRIEIRRSKEDLVDERASNRAEESALASDHMIYDEVQEREKLARAIRRQCDQRGLSVSALAKKAQISKSSLSLIVNGRTLPSLHTLFQICNALGVTMEELLVAKNAKD